MSGYRIVRLTTENIPDYIYIFSRVFGYEPTPSAVLKKFSDSSGRFIKLGFLAFDEKQQPAAYYGVFPTEYNFNGKPIACAQSGSTMTLPEHQGKGLFVKLAQQCYDLAAKQGLQFVFGMPNKLSYRGLERLNWIFSCQMLSYRFFVPSLSLIKHLFNRKQSSYFFEDQDSKHNTYRFRFFETLDLNSSAAALFLNFNAARPPEFYKTKPGHLLVRNGLAIWVKAVAGKKLQIGDIFIPPGTEPSVPRNLLNLLLFSSFLKGISQLQFYCSPHIKTKPCFKFPWIKTQGLHYGYLPLAAAPNGKKGEALHMSFGDFDTF